MNNYNKKEMIKIISKYLVLIICLLVSAINFNLLMKPANFVTGGTPGLSIIIEYFFGIPTDYFIYFIYIVTFILSFLILGKQSIIGVLVATICYPLFVTLTGDIIKYIVIDYNDFFLLCLFSGVINGICNGFIYKFGFASSGITVLGPICNKCFHLPIAFTNFIINIVIVLIGGLFFGIEMVLYATIFLYLSSFISNKIILSISNNKVILIRSTKIDEINKYVYDKLSIEPINIDVVGGYSNKEGVMSLLVITTYRYNMIIEGIKKIDCNVFYNVLDGYEVENSKMKE